MELIFNNPAENFCWKSEIVFAQVLKNQKKFFKKCFSCKFRSGLLEGSISYPAGKVLTKIYTFPDQSSKEKFEVYLMEKTKTCFISKKESGRQECNADKVATSFSHNSGKFLLTFQKSIILKTHKMIFLSRVEILTSSKQLWKPCWQTVAEIPKNSRTKTEEKTRKKEAL